MSRYRQRSFGYFSVPLQHVHGAAVLRVVPLDELRGISLLVCIYQQHARLVLLREDIGQRNGGCRFPNAAFFRLYSNYKHAFASFSALVLYIGVYRPSM